MLPNSIYTKERVSEYLDRGFAPIPIKFRSKQPLNEGWPDLQISHDDIGKYFDGEPTNIGIVTGKRQGANGRACLLSMSTSTNPPDRQSGD